MLKGKPHNNHTDEDEDFETAEVIKYDDNGDIELDDDDVINESTMKMWLRNAQEII